MATLTHGYTQRHTSKHLLTCLSDDDSGQDLVEYALVAAALGLFAFAGMHNLANSIANAFNTVLQGFAAASGQA